MEVYTLTQLTGKLGYVLCRNLSSIQGRESVDTYASVLVVYGSEGLLACFPRD
jgi:hypothetical protein